MHCIFPNEYRTLPPELNVSGKLVKYGVEMLRCVGVDGCDWIMTQIFKHQITLFEIAETLGVCDNSAEAIWRRMTNLAVPRGGLFSKSSAFIERFKAEAYQNYYGGRRAAIAGLSSLPAHFKRNQINRPWEHAGRKHKITNRHGASGISITQEQVS